MPTIARRILAAAAVLLLIATGLGAYAAHGLAGRIGASELRSVELAIQYQFFASLGLVGVGLLADRYPDAGILKLTAIVLGAGILLFCGGIYASALGAPEAVGRAAPIGGVAMMAGWALLAVSASRLGRGR